MLIFGWTMDRPHKLALNKPKTNCQHKVFVAKQVLLDVPVMHEQRAKSATAHLQPGHGFGR